jgi:hypothetical protein
MGYSNTKNAHIGLIYIAVAFFFTQFEHPVFCAMHREHKKRDSEKQEIALKKLSFIKII